MWLFTLELDRRATRKEIDQAYRQLVQVWHPDRFGHNPPLQLKAQEKLKQINEAYRGLTQTIAAGTSAGSMSRTEPSKHVYDQNSTTVQCPRCFRTGRVSSSRLHRITSIRCPHCGELFRFGSGNDEQSGHIKDAGDVSAAPRPTGSRAGSRVGWLVVLGAGVLVTLVLWSRQGTRSSSANTTPESPVVSYRSPPSSPLAVTLSRSSPTEFYFDGLDREACVTGAYARPASGTDLGDRPLSGLGRVRITNGTARDAVVVLSDEASNESRRAIYIRGGDERSITSVPKGRYRLRYQFGDRWLRRRFCELWGTSEFAETLIFAEKADERGKQYETFDVTLHPVPDDTARTNLLPDVPLPLPPP